MAGLAPALAVGAPAAERRPEGRRDVPAPRRPAGSAARSSSAEVAACPGAARGGRSDDHQPVAPPRGRTGVPDRAGDSRSAAPAAVALRRAGAGPLLCNAVLERLHANPATARSAVVFPLRFRGSNAMAAVRDRRAAGPLAIRTAVGGTQHGLARLLPDHGHAHCCAGAPSRRTDVDGGLPVAIVNERMAALFGDAIRLAAASTSAMWVTVVGVVVRCPARGARCGAETRAVTCRLPVQRSLHECRRAQRSAGRHAVVHGRGRGQGARSGPAPR
jgi:hypothetical protein